MKKVKNGMQKKYKEDELDKAIDEVKLGKALRKVAATYHIPPTTLHNKVKGIYPIHVKKGPPTILNFEEEKQIKEWILYSEERGFPVTQEQVLNSVMWLVADLKKVTPFKNGKPGRHWIESFYRRHPELSKRKPQNLCYSRASVTEHDLRQWFEKIKLYLENNNLLYINPKRIFNGDESGFRLAPDVGQVIVRKGVRTVHKIVGSNEKEQITTLFVYNAAGDRAPPLVLFNYQRIPTNIAAKFPKGFSIGRTDNGWMTSESFFQYITNVFHPWLQKQNIDVPVILYLDGHSSHFTLPLSKFCKEKNIILIPLYPNATHIIQPLDRTFFKSMKKAWVTAVEEYKRKNLTINVKKEDFGCVLNNALRDLNATDIMKNGFKLSGLFPLNADNVDYKLLKFRNVNSQRETDLNLIETENTADYKICLRVIEQNLNIDILADIQKSEIAGEWIGDIENKGLFQLWNKLNNCGLSKNSIPGNSLLQSRISDIGNLNLSDIPIILEHDLSENSVASEIEIVELDFNQNVEGHTPNNESNVDKNFYKSSTLQEIVVNDDNCNSQNISTCPKEINLTEKNCNQEQILNETKFDHGVQNKENLVSRRAHIPRNVSSPFRRCLSWPPDLGPKKKNNKKTQNIAVATTEEWIQMHEQEAEQKKIKQEDLKAKKELAAQRKLEREKKQELQQKRLEKQKEKSKKQAIKEEQKLIQVNEKMLKRKAKEEVLNVKQKIQKRL